MLCQNCGKNEANIRYTQIINGVKKEINICSECAKILGMEDLEMPINFNSFLGEFFNDYAEAGLLQSFQNDEIKCKKCGMTYSDFINSGMFGCSQCYNVFSGPIESLLKNLHGNAKHVGRIPKAKGTTKYIEDEKFDRDIENMQTTTNKTNIEDIKKDEKINKLENDLELAIKEERYEDAAKIRDELKEMNK